jgi:pyruvate, water dikinase
MNFFGVQMSMEYIRNFSQISINDIGLVGGKAASLGNLYTKLARKGIRVPNGFAITADAYWYFINANGLMPHIEKMMDELRDFSDIEKVQQVGHHIRNLFRIAPMPPELGQHIIAAYQALGAEYQQKNIPVAVRSSATAEDLPGASFAGQQESYLNISGKEELLDACKKCFASLFTDRAIVYRHDQQFDYKKIALSIVVQKMVRSDKGSSGVAFTLDTETGFKDAILINGSYGLGDSIVQGLVVPDEYVVFKPTLAKGFAPIIKKEIGSKKVKTVYRATGTEQASVPSSLQIQQCINDQEILEIAKAASIIEELYSQEKGSWCPMDIEWAKDGIDNLIYIVQARPETVHAQHTNGHSTYRLQAEQAPTILATGQSIGQQIVSGPARVINSPNDIHLVQVGDIIVSNMTDPDWVPALKKAVGIITQMGGRTCHAAIVARELRIPALVGSHDAMTLIKNGQEITLDCSQGSTGYVYQGAIPFAKETVALESIPEAPTKLMINLADPDRAFSLSMLPVSGVGLARIEFIITNTIKIHPLALLYPDVLDKKTIKKIDELTAGFADKKEFYINKLAQGIATIAAAFYPKPVIVRLSDFKTNEYRNLIGGSYFEPEEENPMIGFRGSVRYYSPKYKEAFALECAALKIARHQFGLTNIKVMVPFVRTLQEGKKVIEQMRLHGLSQDKGLEIIMMCEIPSNVILIDEFLEDFDGISIGSNDLTQLTLAVDRDSPFVSGVFDERDPAMKKMFQMAIAGTKKAGRYSSICGQAPSDYPELAEYLISLGIESISLNPDSVIPFLMRYQEKPMIEEEVYVEEHSNDSNSELGV